MSTDLHTPAWAEEKESLIFEDENLQEQVPSLTVLDGGLSLNEVMEDEPLGEQWYQSSRYRFKDANGQNYPAWEKKKLGEVAEWYNGYAFKPDDLVKPGTRHYVVPVVKIKEMLDQGVIEVFTDLGEIPPQNVISRGDILFSWSMTMKAVRWLGDEAFLNQHIYKVVPSEGVNDYLLYFLQENEKRIANLAHGGTAKHITRPTLMKFPLPLPSLPEQEKIAGFLGALDDRITGQEKLVDLLEQRKKAYSQRIFNGSLRFKDENGQDYPEWEEKKLGEILDIRNGISHRNVKEGEDKYPVYGSSSIIGYVAKSICESDSIVYGRKGTIDKPQYAEYPFWASDTTLFAGLNEKSRYSYDLRYVFLYSQTVDYKRLSTSSGLPSLTKKTISDINIPLPSLPEQEKIAGFLGALDTEVEQEKKKLEAYKEEKKAFSQRIFGL